MLHISVKKKKKYTMDVVESSWITLIAYVLYKVQNTFFFI